MGISLTRRNFVAASAAAGAAVAASAGLTSAASATEAVAAGLSEAQPIPPAAVPEAWDDECDVLVVGLGAGGLAAAGYLAQNGLKVIAIDKDAITGGASRHAGTIVSLYGGAKDQEEMGWGYPVYPLDINAYVRNYCEEHLYAPDQRLIRSVALAGGPCMDWVMAQEGITLVGVGLGYLDVAMATGQQNHVLGLTNTMDQLTDVAVKAGADIRLMNQATQLVVDGDAVVGAVVNDENGDDRFVHTNKAVLLCAGGIGMNKHLVETYLPSVAGFVTSGGPMPTHTGEAFRIALGAGADVAGFDAWNCWECCPDRGPSEGSVEPFQYFWNGARQLFHNPWLIINAAGERMPYFAANVQPDFTYACLIQMGDMSNNAAWCDQPGQRVYSICDANFATTIEHMVVFPGAGDASRVPLREGDPTIEQPYVTNDWLAEVNESVENGWVKKADTIEELAEMLGLNPDVVVAAVENWNVLCEQGVDTEMAWPYDSTWLNPIVEPPFYAAALGGQIGKTGVGVRVNDKLQARRADGSLVPGLYANFSTAGGFMGAGAFSEMWNGSQNGGVGQSLITGWLAADSILKA